MTRGHCCQAIPYPAPCTEQDSPSQVAGLDQALEWKPEAPYVQGHPSEPRHHVGPPSALDANGEDDDGSDDSHCSESLASVVSFILLETS